MHEVIFIIVISFIVYLILSSLLTKKTITGGMEENFLILTKEELGYLPNSIQTDIKTLVPNLEAIYDRKFVILMQGSYLMSIAAFTEKNKIKQIEFVRVNERYRGTDCVFDMLYNIKPVSIKIEDPTMKKYYMEKGFKPHKKSLLLS